ncbi:hypothetical protein [Jannaschia pohangensis]|uniref:Uncharacterized protein n=1 Tax=Jannaschia pohangensis TaxID=390807 RepID=A0A1I3GQK9_9RHOB|nr:hypothetical protein [Jannaschia pohangensis]SFI25730.1 hypothetical protein SAMN04488095_0291 [Jannaschia pohangensis]
MIAAFHYVDDELRPCIGQDDVSDHAPAAAETLALWTAAQGLGKASIMMLKSDGRVHLAAATGGLIVEAQDTLNIGLMRASSKTLAPARPDHRTSFKLPSDDRFRRAFWAVVSRLHASVLPRTFAFELAQAQGTISVADGSLRFDGDFTDPATFVAALRKACTGKKAVRYTLADDDGPQDAPPFTLSDLLAQVTDESGSGEFVFDADGWPLASAAGSDFATVQALSAIAAGLLGRNRETSSISVLSDSNSVILTGTTSSEGYASFNLK